MRQVPLYRTLVGMSDGSTWVVVTSRYPVTGWSPGVYAFDVEVPTYRWGIRRGFHTERRHLNLRQMCWAEALS